MRPIDWDRIAGDYDARYAFNPLPGVAGNLLGLAKRLRPDRALEVGCGTGHWLGQLAPHIPQLIGVDRSVGMLRAAAGDCCRLVGADAGWLPFRPGSFDLVFVVNALHHFASPQGFLAWAHRLLRPGGALSLVIMDPHSEGHRCYLYELFDGTRQADLALCPAEGSIRAWLERAGFQRIESRQVERIERRFSGPEVLGDYFLGRSSGSQLARLTDRAYRSGVARLRAALADAESSGDEIHFDVEITLRMMTAWRQDA